MIKQDLTPSIQGMSFLKFVNDATIEKKKLKIRSFYLFHKCQYSCLKDLNNKESETCMQNCQIELDKFQEFRKSKRPEHKVFHSVPQDLKQIEEMNFSQEEYMLAQVLSSFLYLLKMEYLVMKTGVSPVSAGEFKIINAHLIGLITKDRQINWKSLEIAIK